MSFSPVAPGDREPDVSPGSPPPPDGDGSQAQQLLAQLQQRMESLPTIEQAKGIVMGRFGLDAEAAFRLLVRWSQRNNLKLRTVSALLTDAARASAALDDLVDTLQQSGATGVPVVQEGRGEQVLEEEVGR
jgi:hypothetical protein